MDTADTERTKAALAEATAAGEALAAELDQAVREKEQVANALQDRIAGECDSFSFSAFCRASIVPIAWFLCRLFADEGFAIAAVEFSRTSEAEKNDATQAMWQAEAVAGRQHLTEKEQLLQVKRLSSARVE